MDNIGHNVIRVFGTKFKDGEYIFFFLNKHMLKCFHFPYKIAW